LPGINCLQSSNFLDNDSKLLLVSEVIFYYSESARVKSEFLNYLPSPHKEYSPEADCR